MASMDLLGGKMVDRAVLRQLAVPAAIAIFGWLRKWLTLDGAVAGFVVGAAIVNAGWDVTAMLFVFFFLGSYFTKLAARRSSKPVEADAKHGRNMWQVLSTAGIPALLCIFRDINWFFVDWKLYCFAYFACGCGDTLASEIGQMSGDIPKLILTMKKVQLGKDGGVSFTGTLASLLGGLAIGVCGGSCTACGLGALFGGIGSLLDSFLGAALQASFEDQSGAWKAWNNLVNVLSSIMTILCAIMISAYPMTCFILLTPVVLVLIGTYGDWNKQHQYHIDLFALTLILAVGVLLTVTPVQHSVAECDGGLLHVGLTWCALPVALAVMLGLATLSRRPAEEDQTKLILDEVRRESKRMLDQINSLKSQEAALLTSQPPSAPGSPGSGFGLSPLTPSRSAEVDASTQRRMVELESAKANADTQVRRLTERMSTLEESIASKQTEINRLRRQTEDSRSLESQNRKLNNRLKDLEDNVLSAKQAEIDRLKTRASSAQSLQESLSKAEKEVKRLRAEQTKLSSKGTEWENKLKAAEEELKTLRAAKRSDMASSPIRDFLFGKSNSPAVDEQELESLREALRLKETAHREEMARLEAAQEDYAKELAENLTKEAQDRFKAKVRERIDMIVAEHDLEKEELYRENERLVQRLQGKNIDLDGADPQELALTVEELARTREQLVHRTHEVESLRQQAADLTGEDVSELRAKLARSEALVVSLKESTQLQSAPSDWADDGIDAGALELELHATQARLKSVSEDLLNREHEIESLRQQLFELQRLSDVLYDSDMSISTTIIKSTSTVDQDQLMSLQKQLLDKNRTISELQHKSEYFVSERAKCHEQLHSLQSKVKLLEDKAAIAKRQGTRSDSSDDLMKLQNDRIAKLTEELRQARESSVTTTHTSSSLAFTAASEELDSTRKALHKAEDRNEDLQKQIVKLQTELQSASSANSSPTRQSSEITHLKSELNTAQMRIDFYKQKLDTLEKADAAAENARLRKRIQKLENSGGLAFEEMADRLRESEQRRLTLGDKSAQSTPTKAGDSSSFWSNLVSPASAVTNSTQKASYRSTMMSSSAMGSPASTTKFDSSRMSDYSSSKYESNSAISSPATTKYDSSRSSKYESSSAISSPYVASSSRYESSSSLASPYKLGYGSTSQRYDTSSSYSSSAYSPSTSNTKSVVSSSHIESNTRPRRPTIEIVETVEDGVPLDDSMRWIAHHPSVTPPNSAERKRRPTIEIVEVFERSPSQDDEARWLPSGHTHEDTTVVTDTRHTYDASVVGKTRTTHAEVVKKSHTVSSRISSPYSTRY